MTLTSLAGKVRFKVDGQEALTKWARQALADAMERNDSPPESLRFQCRIATDARKNLAVIPLKDGNTLTLHPNSHPQFGKNRDGHAYLTATMTYSGDGQNYTIKWVGDAVPHEMQEVAVKHDKGLKVARTVIDLDLARAQVLPAWKAQKHAKVRDHKKEEANRSPRVKQTRGKRTCARLTEADIAV